ncbi:MAG: LysR family substrate-binding domain-containing protein, partial [Acidimicrobiales bacterium]
GFVDSASYEVMPRLLRAHRQRWPSVEYELLSMSTDAQHESLVGRRIDLGIGRASRESESVRSTHIVKERLALAVPADHRLASQKQTSIGRLRGEAFIGFDRSVSPSLHGELVTMFSEKGADYDPIIEATEYTTIVGLVASGQGVAVVPAAVRSFNPPGLRYLELSDPAATSNLFMLSREAERSPLVARAIELATEVSGWRESPRAD